MRLRSFSSGKKIVLISAAMVLAAAFLLLFLLKHSLLTRYEALESATIRDRNGLIVSESPNSKGEYGFYIQELPKRVAELVVKKEDKFFYWHPGFNPISIGRAALHVLSGKAPGGSSTITQQLAKNLLGNETDRNLVAKSEELFYALSLELFLSKKSILTMYGNTVYLGNNIQGLGQGALDYFGKDLGELTDSEIIMLLATISNPSVLNPWQAKNQKAAVALAKRLGVEISYEPVKPGSAHQHKTEESFELESLGLSCQGDCWLTIDKKLSEGLRAILRRNIDQSFDAGARNGAIVVLKEPENEILAIIGSPNPWQTENGNGINMASEPRPIGSTAKPFIFAKGFEDGLRPYSLVDDREYKFPIATSFPIYPKNYDGIYHGIVTLHESLSNSYNVPAVKVLEYVGLDPFYNFLENSLLFQPLQELDTYQYGIALGGLEMDPLTLASYFSIFPNNGMLKPLQILTAGKMATSTPFHAPMSGLISEKQVTDPKYVELVNRILNDRKAGVEQFGLESNLNLTQSNYAVKTGTSRDYHDSWTVGFTPDFVVAVWLGNAENEPLKQISGSIGAGEIWNESMQLLFNSDYNKKTPLDFSKTAELPILGSLDFGLPDDVIAEHRDLLLTKRLILSPHDGDLILLEPDTVIPLKAAKPVSWFVNGNFLGSGQEFDFQPKTTGLFTIKAASAEKAESLKIKITGDKTKI